jgi:hypothetical protein
MSLILTRRVALWAREGCPSDSPLGQYTSVSPVQGMVPAGSPSWGSASLAFCWAFVCWRFAAAAWLPKGAIALRCGNPQRAMTLPPRLPCMRRPHALLSTRPLFTATMMPAIRRAKRAWASGPRNSRRRLARFKS